MALGPVLAATAQAAFLGGLSNVLAQLMTTARRRDQAELSVDWIPVLQFVLFSIVSTPPNFLWQIYLEGAFPARRRRGGPLSARNTAAKVLLDQTVGAAANTLLFSVFVRALRDAMAPAPRLARLPAAAAYCLRPGAVDFARVRARRVLAAARADFWPVVRAGLKFWPFVSLLNFTLVSTVSARNLVGALAGVAWGVYMSMVAAG